MKRFWRVGREWLLPDMLRGLLTEASEQMQTESGEDLWTET